MSQPDTNIASVGDKVWAEHKNTVERAGLNPPNMTVKKLLFSFEGRIGRKSLWGVVFLLVLFNIGNSFITYGFVSRLSEEQFIALLFVETVMAILLDWCSIATYVKRWHDRDKSGWWVLLIVITMVDSLPLISLPTLVAVIGSIGWLWTLIECGFLPGSYGENKYGQPEKWSDSMKENNPWYNAKNNV
jgi:uncharacterized membrane protein YhaH (DUF805 family)